jgi:hypothetical protein
MEQVMNKPKDMVEYRQWLSKERGWSISSTTKVGYEETASLVRRTFETGSYWQHLVNRFPVLQQEYKLRTDYDLFMRQSPPELFDKPYESFLIKTFRKNVLENSKWPKEPTRGWFNPNDCYPRINDLVRTTVVVKYLDGVRYFATKAVELGKEEHLDSRVYYEARPEGYYAAHMYIYPVIELPRGTDTVKEQFSVEIQITTQLKEVMRQLTHKSYEKRREGKLSPSDEKWQWDHQSDEFVPNYLGHMLHYLEGMIMQVREKQGGSV